MNVRGFRQVRAAQGLVLVLLSTGGVTGAIAQSGAAVDNPPDAIPSALVQTPPALPSSASVAPDSTLQAAAAPAVDDGACQDDWPADRERPKLVQRFPKRGISGHVARLELDIEHLPGEVVFPAGLEAMQLMSGELTEERARLTEAQFKLPSAKSEIKPTLERPKGDAQGRVKTLLSFPLIPLPDKAGRFELTLPRLPIAISRASGQVHTICTQPHVITVEDPLASEATPDKKPNPEPRSQLEIWTSLKNFVLNALWVIPLVLLLGWLLYRYRDAFKKKVVPPPPIPPWERARGQLLHLESQGLLQAGEFEEYLDGVTDTLREYLGGRYGFDGLECTTRELLRQLGSRATDFSEEQLVRTILQHADLVKFARRTPSEDECKSAFAATKKIIDLTVPTPSLDPRAAGAAIDWSKQSGPKASASSAKKEKS